MGAARIEGEPVGPTNEREPVGPTNEPERGTVRNEGGSSSAREKDGSGATSNEDGSGATSNEGGSASMRNQGGSASVRSGRTRDTAQNAGPLTIAIDGPAASGKSTIGRALARALGLLYLDTGTMYRAVTWLAQRRGIDLGAEAAVTALAEQAVFAFPGLGASEHVNPPIAIDGLDATAGIREPVVDAGVSLVSSYAGVRAALVREQQALARARGVVMVGRDIGTVVLPEAPLKIYLIAGAQERARRRYEERVALGKAADYDEIYAAMERRDRLDAERAHSPLHPAADAVLLDTTGLPIEAVVARALELARAAQESRRP